MEQAQTDTVDGEIVLDDGVVGVLGPVLPNADHHRIVELKEAAGSLPAGSLVIDARWVDGVLVAIDSQGRLRVHDGSERVLDEQVAPPLAVRGTRVAYVRGEMPTYEVAWVDVRSGAATALTEGHAPAWNPAIGPDGDVVFVSGRDGTPRLYRVVEGGDTQPLDVQTNAFPSALVAPVWDGRNLMFRDESGVSHLLEVGR